MEISAACGEYGIWIQQDRYRVTRDGIDQKSYRIHESGVCGKSESLRGRCHIKSRASLKWEGPVVFWCESLKIGDGILHAQWRHRKFLMGLIPLLELIPWL